MAQKHTHMSFIEMVKMVRNTAETPHVAGRKKRKSPSKFIKEDWPPAPQTSKLTVKNIMKQYYVNTEAVETVYSESKFKSLLKPSKTMNYLVSAADKLHSVGINLFANNQRSISASLLEEVKTIDVNSTLEIAKTFEAIESFAEIMRENTTNTQVLDQHENISGAFESIRLDALELKKQEEKDKLAVTDKMRNAWMVFRRGSIPTRFKKIDSTFKNVIIETDKTLQREQIVLDSYVDFRGALLLSQAAAQRMLKQHTPKLDEARAKYLEFADKANVKDLDPEQKAILSEARDRAQHEFEIEERKNDVLKRISENLTVSYNASESVIASLYQTYRTKLAVNDQSKIFFTTNANLFTAIGTTINSIVGTRAAARTQKAMADGMNNSIETIAELSGKVNEEAIKIAHGATIKASSVSKLVDAIENYQTETRRLAAEARIEATRNAEEMQRITDEGKKRIAESFRKSVADEHAMLTKSA